MCVCKGVCGRMHIKQRLTVRGGARDGECNVNTIACSHPSPHPHMIPYTHTLLTLRHTLSTPHIQQILHTPHTHLSPSHPRLWGAPWYEPAPNAGPLDERPSGAQIVS